MRVLVVEDEVPLADAVARGLRREGMAVDVAYDGDSGLEKAMITRYDVVVLDRDLPVMSGDDLCRQLTSDETWIPPKLLTGVLRDLRRQEHERNSYRRLVDGLTAREREILRYMVAGASRAERARHGTGSTAGSSRCSSGGASSPARHSGSTSV